MNERIKLPDQEWLGYDPEKGDMHGYTFEQMRGFAEFIVKECCTWIDGSPTTEDGQLILSKSFIIANLKKHFGVKE